MSADSFQICPNCEKLNTDEENKYWEDVDKSYGEITKDQYKEKISNPPKFELDETLAEYYKIGIDNIKMELFIRFQAECYVCGFKYKYEKDIKIKKWKKAI